MPVLPFDQPDRIFGKLLERVQMLLDLIHGGSRPIWKKKVPDARWSYLQKPREWAAPTHYAAVGLRCKGQGCLYTGNIARQDRTQVQQWRVVTVRRCTAARQTSQPAERKRKRTTSSVCCLLLLLQWEYPAGWLGWLEGGEGGVGGAPGQQLAVYLPASMHSSNRGWPVQCHLLALWKPLFGNCIADKAPFWTLV